MIVDTGWTEYIYVYIYHMFVVRSPVDIGIFRSHDKRFIVHIVHLWRSYLTRLVICNGRPHDEQYAHMVLFGGRSKGVPLLRRTGTRAVGMAILLNM